MNDEAVQQLDFYFITDFSMSGFGQDSTKYLTIKQCVDLAIKNNLQVQQSQIQLEQNGVYFKQSKDNLLPQINGTIQQQFNYGRSISTLNNSYVDVQNGQGNYSLNANLVLFNGLSLQNAIKQNALSYNASKMDLQQQKDNITLNVITELPYGIEQPGSTGYCTQAGFCGFRPGGKTRNSKFTRVPFRPPPYTISRVSMPVTWLMW